MDDLMGDIFIELPFPEDGKHYVLTQSSSGNMNVLKEDITEENTKTFLSRSEAIDHIRSEIERECVHLDRDQTTYDLTPEQFAKCRETQAGSKVAKMSRRGRGNRRDGNIMGYVGNNDFDGGVFVFTRPDEKYQVYFAHHWKKYYCNIE